jgi:glycosyltransferase involved in cell wall biosynthesis
MKESVSHKKRIRVLINGLHAKSGGGVTYLRNMLPLLAEDDRLDLHLFLHIDQFDLFDPVDDRVHLHIFDFRSNLLNLLLWEQMSLPLLARTMSADVTFSPANYGPLFAPAPVIMLRNALAVVGAETRPHKWLYWSGLAFMTAVSLFTCVRAIAVSEYARRALTFGFGNRLLGKVSVIYHGVDRRFSPAESAVGDNPYLLAVADIYVQKNLHTLITAMKTIRKEYPEIQLRIAGRLNDVGYYGELKKLIDDNQLEESVSFLGERSVPDLIKLYRNCSVFVFPSTVETFGNPLAEAMACGAPIAASNAAAMPEVVGETAQLFDPLDSSGMARQILTYLNNPEFAQSMGAKGRVRSKMFSWPETARKTSDVLVTSARNG